ncbi:Phospholipase d gamma 2 [Globisporangium polare]
MGDQICPCRPCHACTFDAELLICKLILSDGLDLSDGADLPVDQPETDPSAWFLTQDEITASRGGIPRDDLAVYSTGNSVSAFVAPQEFFHAVFTDVRATSKGDRIFLTSWTADNTPFEPKVDPSGEISGFQNVFGHAVVRGAEFYALAYPNVWEKKGNTQVRDFLHGRLPASPNGGQARFLFDDRLASEANSHHQKTLVIESSSGTIAYVGGIDLTVGRWDDLKHSQPAGWMDCHVRIAGSAAADVAANFLSRWNSSVKPGDSFTGERSEFANPEYTALPEMTRTNLPVQSHGHHAVQIVRTYNPGYRELEAAPIGERSLFDARIKAIRTAKNYIYIEDQYFVLVPQLLEELMKVLPGLQRLIVVVQRPGSDENYAAYKKLLHDMAAPLQRRFPNKLQLYTTKQQRNIYVHTKLVLVDDVYLSIGSANWNDCSMLLDSELNANVVDQELVTSRDGVRVTELALDYRIRKFVELTGLSYESLRAMTFLQAADQLDAATKDPRSILDDLEPEERNYAPL